MSVSTERQDGGSQASESPARGIAGERGRLLAAESNSAARRFSNLLAMVFAGLAGVAALTWYYTGVYRRGAQVATRMQRAEQARASSEMVLPPLEVAHAAAAAPLAGLMPGAAPAAPASLAQLAPAPEPAVDLPPEPGTDSLPLSAAPPAPAGSSSVAAATTATPARSPLERRLSGVAFARSSATAPMTPAAPDVPQDSADMQSGSARGTELEAVLRPSTMSAVRARLLPTRQMLLPKGAFLDCTLETAIDSSLPGMTTCVTASDTFGADGRVVLLERGTKLVGETRGQVRQGTSRVFVLWTEARTPKGVVVPLESPGTDELGRAGLPGTVERHFWDRFGAAILISTIDGALQSAAADAGHGGNTVIWGPSASQGVLTEILKETISIPPTVRKRNGDRIQVLVARDLDFRSVYALRRARAQP